MTLAPSSGRRFAACFRNSSPHQLQMALRTLQRLKEEVHAILLVTYMQTLKKILKVIIKYTIKTKFLDIFRCYLNKFGK